MLAIFRAPPGCAAYPDPREVPRLGDYCGPFHCIQLQGGLTQREQGDCLKRDSRHSNTRIYACHYCNSRPPEQYILARNKWNRNGEVLRSRVEGNIGYYSRRNLYRTLPVYLEVQFASDSVNIRYITLSFCFVLFFFSIAFYLQVQVVGGCALSHLLDKPWPRVPPPPPPPRAQVP